MPFERPLLCARLVWTALLVAFAGAIAFGATLGCGGDEDAPELLTVRDLAPSSVETDGRLEVFGVNLPTGPSHEAEIVFRGTVLRPGQRPRANHEIRAFGGVLHPDRVSFPMTPRLLAEFTGEGDEATHATFEGSVEVRIEGSRHDGLAVRGTLRQVRLDVHPKPARRGVMQARESEADEVLRHFGIGVRSGEGTNFGLVIETVELGSPAASAGIAPSDRIVRLDGVTVTHLTDVLPSGDSRKAKLVVRRGDDLRVHELSILGLRTSALGDLLWPAVALGTAGMCVLLLATPLGRGLTWLEHRLALRFGRTKRIGLSKKKEGTPQGKLALLGAALVGDAAPSANASSSLSPWLVVALGAAFTVALPFAGKWLRVDVDVSALLLAMTCSLTTAALVTAGGGGAVTDARGALRSFMATLGRAFGTAATVLLAQVPLVLVIGSVLVLSGSLRLDDLLGTQAAPRGSVGGKGAWPWAWWALRAPSLLVAVFFAFAPALLETTRGLGVRDELDDEASASDHERARARRDARADAPVSLASVVFGFARGLHLFVSCALLAAVLFGGWQLPGVSRATLEAKAPLLAIGALFFLAKTLGLAVVALGLRSALPRLRAGELALAVVRVALPASAIASALALVPGLVAPARSYETLLGPVALAVTTVLTALVAFRIRSGLRRPRARLGVNPFV